MKKYTKVISALLILCLALGLTACGREEKTPASGSDIVYSDLPSTSTDIYIPIPASDTDIQTSGEPDSELPR